MARSCSVLASSFRGRLSCCPAWAKPISSKLGELSAATRWQASPQQRSSTTAAAQGPRTVEFVQSADRARQLAEELLSLAALAAQEPGGPATEGVAPELCQEAYAVGLDCEGVRLGRFGRLCLMQLAAPGGRFFMLDALRPGVAEGMAPLLESSAVVKVLHDCREDSAALFHQHGILMRSVFDTQAVSIALLRLAGLPPHQVSSGELLRTRLAIEEDPGVTDMKVAMTHDDRLWARRPLSSQLVRYALQGVTHLLPLREAMLPELELACEQAGKRSRDPATQVLNACRQAVDYCFLNQEFSSAKDMAPRGTQLWALVTASTDVGVYCKLNAGRIGLVSTPSALDRFRDVEVGDVVLCCVSGLSLDGRYLYLDRYDHDWDFFDHQRRPSGEPEVGVYGREHRHRTTLLLDPVHSNADPLLLRGLPAGDELLGPEGRLDAWDAGPEDVGLPADYDA